MKKYMAGLAVVGLLALGLSGPAHADLVVSGTVEYDGAQRNLIYDTDLNITWLDYTHVRGYIDDFLYGDQADTQMYWAADLSLTVNGITYDNWRLPATVDGPWVNGYDGTNTVGYNITTSEMGHLWYTELGNKARVDTSGNYQTVYGLTNKGPFANLLSYSYWSGTEHMTEPGGIWYFSMASGTQGPDFISSGYYALAVLPGQIQAASVPEPTSMLLIGSGLAGLFGLKRRKK